jgi:UDP-N-acetylglucosamine/UDP-N-acetylgalactosamine diphosphorylase
MSQGVTDVFLFQFPNVLEKVCDPMMLGFHEARQHDMTLKGFRYSGLGEKVGRIIQTDRTLVREYHYPTPNPTRYLANMGTYLIKLRFIQRCHESGFVLPWHEVPLHFPGLPPLLRAEQFIFDLLAFTRDANAVKVNRSQEYATIKEPEGENSPHAARRALLRTYREWLRQAGARPETPHARVEISPSFALDAATVRKKITPGTVYSDGTLFQ